MKKLDKLSYRLIILFMLLMYVGCADDADLQPEQDVHFCVQCSWQNGRGGETRAYSLAESLLAEGKGPISIDPAAYPATINVHCSDGKDFTLTKGGDACGEHSDYYSYTPSIIYKETGIANLTFEATATIDDGDVLSGTAEKENLADTHLQFHLHHTKALLRFAFQVSEKYDQVRQIKITQIKLNDNVCTLVDKVLSTDMTLIAYAYINVASGSLDCVTLNSENTLKCTYDIYDKDADFGATPSVDNSAHIVRKNVEAKNTFKLNALKDAQSNPISEIGPGFYYDLNITLNPDYLYVLSEHDNKHITIE